jgi:hypothetical protein
MSENKEVIINGIRYLPVQESSPIKIVILQRGWVMIGRFNRVGSDCTLTNAYVIRRWGTSKGLGELAEEGEKRETILDKAGIVKFDYLTVVATIDCDESKWSKIT